ncbi:hypothetical protein AN639_01045 [Candidatus Epulonipiscium fishelsonii]|nr:hypothetical protein AN639_01045 [Epulopiscium sp. SCG-B05WGA-EpuloA1]
MRKIKSAYLIICITIIFYLILRISSSLNVFYQTNVNFKNLKPILLKSNLSDDDYNIIFEQTGISKKGILDMQSHPSFVNDILLYQKIYQKPNNVVTKKNELYNKSREGF